MCLLKDGLNIVVVRKDTAQAFFILILSLTVILLS